MKLHELSTGAVARIISVNSVTSIVARLIDMGLVENAQVKLVRQSPLRYIMQVEVRGSQICLRHDDAQHFEVAVES